MNKELIRKYKEEFDYWINGDKGLLLWVFIKDNDRYRWSSVYKDCDVFEHDSKEEPYDIKAIVINDEFVEFRKALAEGKTIQFLKTHCGNIELSSPEWLDWNSYGECFDTDTKYRIKPDEPKFKVGDKVIVKSNHDSWEDTIIEIKDGKYYFEDGYLAISRQDDQLEQSTKFKVGDWVRLYADYITEIIDIVEDGGEIIPKLSNGQSYKPEYLKLWQPKDGDEIIGFFSDKYNPNAFVVGKIKNGELTMAISKEDAITWKIEQFTKVIPHIGQPFSEMK